MKVVIPAFSLKNKKYFLNLTLLALIETVALA
jgi:hypothetical protein